MKFLSDILVKAGLVVENTFSANAATNTIYAGTGTRLRTEANNLVFERVSSSGTMKMMFTQGTLSPTAKAYIGYSNATLNLILSNEYATAGLELRTSDIIRQQIFANGNIVIGQASPVDAGYKVDITGTVRATGAITASILAGTGTRMVVADSSGVLSTQAIVNPAAVLPVGGTTGQILAKIDNTNYNTEWIDNYTGTVKHVVKAGVALTKGQAVYVSSADGTNMIVSKASNATESTSSKTMGLIAQNLSVNGSGYVVTEGLLSGIDTSTAQAGDPVWLGTDGNLLFGLANKPYAPNHMVYIGVVTRVQQNNGEIFVKVQNGFELNELHDVYLPTYISNGILYRDTVNDLWKTASIETVLGYTPVTNARTLTINGTTYDLTTNRSWSVGTTTGSGSVGQVAYWSGSSTQTGSNSFFWDTVNERLGIGLTNPQRKIEIYSATADSHLRLTGNAPSVSLGEATTGSVYQAKFGLATASGQYASAAIAGDFVIISQTGATIWGTGSTERMRLSFAGNFIVGSSSDSTLAKLQINGSIQQAGVTSSMIKVDSNGVIVAASAGSDFVAPATLASYVPTSRTITINGVSYDLSADRSWTIAGGVTSFNTRTGAITLTSGDVTGALGYTPYNSSNPAGYITSYTETDTLASVTGRGAVTSTSITLRSLLNVNRSDGGAGGQLAYDSAINQFYIWNSQSNGLFSIYTNSAERFRIAADGTTTNNGSIVLTAGNYNSYSPTLTGGGASGTWSITATGNVASRGQSNWNDSTVINNVVGMLAWKNYGNNHVIFDASQSTSPSGTSVNNTNPQVNWSSTYPTLMGWNGSGTYGVRVDSARVADSAGSASSVPWTGVLAGIRENYDLQFRPANNSSSYAGLSFASPGSDSNAGYLLVRGGADNDVYTQNGLTIVADLGWLTLAQRTTAGKGVRIMTGSSVSSTRFEVTTAGATNVYGNLTVNTGGTGTWGPFVVTSTSQWGDGGTQYVTIGAGGAAGIMINNPHIVWNTAENSAAAKFGRSGGVSSGSYYVVGTGASNNFFITKDGAIGSPQLNINSSGNITAAVDFRAPIFYDSDDTGYYADFNTTSNTGIRLRGGILMGPNPTWGAYLQVGGNGNETDYATVAATSGNLHMDAAVGYSMYLNFYHNGIIYLNGTTYSISSNGSYYNGTASYANSAGSAPNGSNINNYYNSTAGEGYGFRFWNGDEQYKISMGVGGQYQYGPVNDYSIKLHMGSGTGRGITMGITGSTPTFAHNTTSGNTQIAGSFTTTSINAPSGYTSFGNPWNTANSAFFPNGITTAGGTNWIYGFTYIGNAPANGAGHEFNADGSMRSTSSHRATIYYDDSDTSFYLDPNGTSNLNTWTWETSARIGRPYYWTNRLSKTSAQFHQTGTNGWATQEGNWDNAWKGGFSGWDIWGSGTAHPQGGQYVHAQGIVSGLHYASPDGGDAYGWMMVGAHNATENRYWLRGKWSTTTSGWVEMITTGNIASYTAGNVNSISSAVGGSYTWTATNYFRSTGGGYSGSLASPPLQAYSIDNNSAYMSFHKGGHYAVNLGLDADNVMRIGGWSAAANRWQLDMSGNMTVAGDVTAYSDARVKENVLTVDNALSKVLSLRGVYYNRTDSDDKKRKIGVIAQETMTVIPEVVNQDNAGMYNVSYGNLGGLFIEAFKEQQKKIEAQDKVIEELKSLISGITK